MRKVPKAETLKPLKRFSTGYPGVDELLGGGISRGSAIVLGGPPGVGKTTLLLQIARHVVKKPSSMKVLYASGEQSTAHLQETWPWLKKSGIVCLGSKGDVYKITLEAERLKPALIIVDSIQTAFVSDVGGNVGSSGQIKAVTNWMAAFGKVENVTVVLISHVNQSYKLPSTITHLVDGVLHLRRHSDPTCAQLGLCTLSCSKNRFAPTVMPSPLLLLTSDEFVDTGAAMAAI